MLCLKHEQCFPEDYVPFREQSYTEDVHAERLHAILNKIFYQGETGHEMCPAASEFSPYTDPTDMWDKECDPCDVCKSFIGISMDGHCPCLVMGTERALERTIEHLYEKHYVSLDCRNDYMSKLEGVFEIE